jgi:hypothetical protein
MKERCSDERGTVGLDVSVTTLRLNVVSVLSPRGLSLCSRIRGRGSGVRYLLLSRFFRLALRRVLSGKSFLVTFKTDVTPDRYASISITSRLVERGAVRDDSLLTDEES